MLIFWIAIFTVLIILSAFFSASETAIIALNEIDIKKIKKKETRKILKKLKNDSNSTIATILICNNAVNIAISSLASLLTLHYLKNISLGLTIGILTGIIIIFGEIIPKTFAESQAIYFSKISAYPLYYLRLILSPFLLGISFIHKILKKKKSKMKESDIILFAELGVEKNIIRKYEKERIEKILEMDSKKCFSFIKPWDKVSKIDADKSISEFLDFAKNKGFSRYPVMKGKKLIGIANIKDAIAKKDKKAKVKSIAKKAPIISKDSHLNMLLRKVKKSKSHMIIVKDKQNIIGIIMLIDVLKHIFGNIEE